MPRPNASRSWPRSRRCSGSGQRQTQALVEEAERHIDKSHDLYQFTSQINRTYSEAEKVRLLEALWRVADADLTVHKYEEHLIRRVADLLHVPHSDFIAAKLRATGATKPRLTGRAQVEAFFTRRLAAGPGGRVRSWQELPTVGHGTVRHLPAFVKSSS